MPEVTSDGLASGQTTESSPSPMYDLDALLNRCMGSIDLVHRVLDKFQQRLPEELEAMEKALELGDTEQVGRIAHRVRGSSATVSAERIMQAATEIESASREGRPAELPARLDHLRDEMKTIRGQFSDTSDGK
jgi:HPt (histidine-containing phosphotransfer) domain-containing protein